jgi:hypothetical protein
MIGGRVQCDLIRFRVPDKPYYSGTEIAIGAKWSHADHPRIHATRFGKHRSELIDRLLLQHDDLSAVILAFFC